MHRTEQGTIYDQSAGITLVLYRFNSGIVYGISVVGNNKGAGAMPAGVADVSESEQRESA